MTITAALLWFRANWGWLRYVLAGVGVLLALWWAYSAIYSAGQADTQAKWDDAVRAAEAKAAADTKLLNEAIAEIDTGITIDMEAVNAVRTVFRDRVRTVAQDVYRDNPECSLPGQLLGDINAAAQGYAAAAAGASGSAVRPAKPPP